MEKINTTFLEKLKMYINIKGFCASDLQNIEIYSMSTCDRYLTLPHPSTYIGDPRYQSVTENCITRQYSMQAKIELTI